MPQRKLIFKNRLLANLSAEDRALLIPHIQLIDLKQRDILYNVGDKYNYVYFIESCVASVLTMMEDGSSIEVGMTGFEGMTPIAAMLDGVNSQQHIVVQLPGKAFKISTVNCKSAFEKSASIRTAMLKFANLFLNLSAQTAACNRLHSVEQRLARWLLLSSDRFQSDILPLTQEYISSMLGVRRVGITEAAGEFQRAGLIRYNHGTITILNRQKLEKIACECYCLDYERFKILI